MSKAIDILDISRRICNKNNILDDLNSKTLHKKYLLLLYFEDVDISLVTQLKQSLRELNFAYV